MDGKGRFLCVQLFILYLSANVQKTEEEVVQILIQIESLPEELMSPINKKCWSLCTMRKFR